MLKLVISLTAIICCCLAEEATLEEAGEGPLDGRIVGGYLTTIDRFPWQVLIRSANRFCGGSIGSDRYIITAGHCMQNASIASISVRAGSSFWNSGGIVLAAQSYTIHPNYSAITFSHDIAVIRLRNALRFNKNIKSIPLSPFEPPHMADAQVSGWGTTSEGGRISPQLRAVDIKLISTKDCRFSPNYNYGSIITDAMICAGVAGKDSCQGDSGGPLIWKGLHVGVVSFGYGCARAGYPGVYAYTVYLRSWLIAAMSETK